MRFAGNFMAALFVIVNLGSYLSAQTTFNIDLPTRAGLEYGGSATRVGFSPKGTYFWASARGEPGRLFVWKTHENKLSLNLPVELWGGGAIWSPDETKIALVERSATKPRWRLGIRSTATGATIKTIDPGPDFEGVKCLEFAHDGNELIGIFEARDSKNFIVRLKLEDGKLRRLCEIKVLNENSCTLSISTSGDYIVTSCGELMIWDSKSGELIGNGGKRSQGALIARFSNDGKEIVTLLDDGTVAIWDCSNIRLPKLVHKVGNIGSVNKIYNKFRVFEGGDKFGLATDNGFSIIDKLGKLLGYISSASFETGGCELSPDGKLAISGGSSIQIWNVSHALRKASGEKLIGLPGYGSNLCLSEDDLWLSTYGDERAIFYNTVTGKITSIERNFRSGGQNKSLNLSSGVPYEHDYERILSADPSTKKKSVVLTSDETNDLVSEKRPKDVTLTTFGSRHLLYTHEKWVLLDAGFKSLCEGGRFGKFIIGEKLGKMLMINNEHKMDLYNTATGKIIEDIKVPKYNGDLLTPMKLDADGKWLYCLSREKERRIFRMNMESLEVEAPFSGHDPVLDRGRRETICTCSSRDILGLIGAKNRLQIWDGGKKELIANLDKPSDSDVLGIIFNSSGTKIFAIVDLYKNSGKDRYAIWMWNLN